MWFLPLCFLLLAILEFRYLFIIKTFLKCLVTTEFLFEDEWLENRTKTQPLRPWWTQLANRNPHVGVQIIFAFFFFIKNPNITTGRISFVPFHCLTMDFHKPAGEQRGRGRDSLIAVDIHYHSHGVWAWNTLLCEAVPKLPLYLLIYARVSNAGLLLLKGTSNHEVCCLPFRSRAVSSLLC